MHQNSKAFIIHPEICCCF